MATGTFSAGFDMSDTSTQAGTAQYGDTLIRVENDPNTNLATLRQDYTGGFGYDSSHTLVAGTLTGFTQFDRGDPSSAYATTVNFADLNTPAVPAFQALTAGDINAFWGLLFAGSDQFSGSGSADVMKSYSGRDNLSGAGGNDTLDGGSSDDVLNGGAGNDTLLGGLGFDTATYAGNRADYTVGRSNGSFTVTSAAEGSDTLRGVEKIAFGDGTSQMLVSAAHASGADFNGDGRGDLLWRSDAGMPSIWTMNGLNTQDATPINGGVVVPLDWNISGTGDFNGDGRGDILWRNADGTPAIWLMNGTNTQEAAPIDGGLLVPNEWTIAGTGDFNGDGRDDIFWRSDAGQTSVWLMNGTSTGTAELVNGGATVATTETVLGMGDFNGDGRDDVLWRSDSGATSVWTMNGTNTLSQTGVSGAAALDNTWSVAGVADFNGDARADILWRHDTDGTPVVWLMNGDQVQTAAAVNGGIAVPLTWNVQATGDFNGDARADIAWRSDDGSPSIWLMNGTNIASADLVNGGVQVPQEWMIT